MKDKLIKLPALLAALGILVTMVPAVEKCQGADIPVNRPIHTCISAGCDGDPGKGDHYRQMCTSWCCPGMNGVQYDPGACLDITNMGDCCVAGSKPWVIHYICSWDS